MASRLRLATFNLESLDDRPGARPALGDRIAALRPTLLKIAADVLCLQEINAQSVEHGAGREYAALDALLAGTPYADFARAATTKPNGTPADIHNLMVLSRFEVVATRQLHHDLVSPPSFLRATAKPAPARATPIYWDRPILHVELDVQRGRRLHVVNLHLRAPLAAPIEGQKLAPFVWRSVAGWAEGFFLAAMKRSGQALEARLAVERIFDASPEAWIAVAGDFNADMREVPVRILCGDVEDTGNAVLASRRLSPLERSVPATARYSVLHHGERLMLDHLLVSPALGRLACNVEIHNLDLGDEFLASQAGSPPLGSFHAPVVAEFELPDTRARSGA